VVVGATNGLATCSEREGVSERSERGRGGTERERGTHENVFNARLWLLLLLLLMSSSVAAAARVAGRGRTVRTAAATVRVEWEWEWVEWVRGAAGLVGVVLEEEDEGGRAVPTVDGGLGRTVPGGRRARDGVVVVVVVEDVEDMEDVEGRETGGLGLAWVREEYAGKEAEAEDGAGEAEEVEEGGGGGCECEYECGGGLRRAPVDV
jgi:hypothetical protein